MDLQQAAAVLRSEAERRRRLADQMRQEAYAEADELDEAAAWVEDRGQAVSDLTDGGQRVQGVEPDASVEWGQDGVTFRAPPVVHRPVGRLAPDGHTTADAVRQEAAQALADLRQPPRRAQPRAAVESASPQAMPRPN